MATRLGRLRVELLRTTFEICRNKNVPDDLRAIAAETLDDLTQVFSAGREVPGRNELVLNAFVARRWSGIRSPTKAQKKAAKAAAARITRRAKRLSELVKKTPKYKSMEFKCIADFDKCRDQRGPDSAICAFAFMICIGRRMIPFMK